MKRTIGTIMTAMVSAAVFMIMLVVVLPAFAQSTSPCAADLKEYCSKDSPGGGRMLKCYEEQKSKFSADCRNWAENAKSYGSIVKEVCAQTLDSRCNSVKGDPLATLECLQSNYVDLTVPCREKLNTFKSFYPMPVK
jgi:hypothetical protein